MSNMNVVPSDDKNVNPAADKWSTPESGKGGQEMEREKIQSGMAEEAIKSANKRSPVDGPTDKPQSVVTKMPERRYASPIDGAPVSRDEYMDIVNSDWK